MPYLLTDWAHLAVADDVAVQARDRVGVRVAGDQEELACLIQRLGRQRLLRHALQQPRAAA